MPAVEILAAKRHFWTSMAEAQQSGGGMPPHKASALAQMRTSYVLGTDGPDFGTTSAASFKALTSAPVTRVKRNMQESHPDRYHNVTASAKEVCGAEAPTHRLCSPSRRSASRPRTGVTSGPRVLPHRSITLALGPAWTACLPPSTNTA